MDEDKPAAVRAVLWPGRTVTLPDGRTGYLTTIVAAFITDEPTTFDRETGGEGVGEVVLVGTSSQLVGALAAIDRGHAPYKLGDAAHVMVSLQDLEPGQPQESWADDVNTPRHLQLMRLCACGATPLVGAHCNACEELAPGPPYVEAHQVLQAIDPAQLSGVIVGENADELRRAHEVRARASLRQSLDE
jgi:hypothetical protein